MLILFLFQADGLFNFDKTITQTVHLVNLDASFPVFNVALNCPTLDAGVSINAAVKAKMDAEVGFIVAGSIIPPRINRLALISS
jgi:hypothetical protein